MQLEIICAFGDFLCNKLRFVFAVVSVPVEVAMALHSAVYNATAILKDHGVERVLVKNQLIIDLQNTSKHNNKGPDEFFRKHHE